MAPNRWQRLLQPFQDAWADPQARSRGARLVVTALASPFLSPLEAESIGELAGFAVRESSRAAAGPPTVACIIPTRDPSVSAGFVAYRLVPTRRPDGIWETTAAVPDVAPHCFADRYGAQLFAQHIWGAQVIETHDGRTVRDREAWDQWCRLAARAGPRPLAAPLGPDYFLATAPAPGRGVLLWRPVLTAQGVTVGVLADHHPLSQTEPPYVFRDVAHAKRVVAQERRAQAAVVPLDHLPGALARQLHPNPSLEEPAATGDSVYRRQVAGPRIRPSSPEPLGMLRPVAPGRTPDMHPAWYVSPQAHGAFAWRPVDAQNLVCLLSPGEDGIWRPARWRDVPTALQALGRAGVWAQRAPTVDPSPPSLRSSPRLRL